MNPAFLADSMVVFTAEHRPCLPALPLATRYYPGPFILEFATQ
jgi:hypothetical protein